MDCVIEYGDDKIVNFNTIIRDQIVDKYNNFKFIYSDEIAKEMVRSVIIDLYDENYILYSSYMQVLLSDSYKMLLHNLKYNILTQSDRMVLDVLDINFINFSDLIDNIKKSEIIFNRMLKSSLDFFSLNLLGKKTVVQDSMIYIEEIERITSLYSLDVFQFGKTNVNDFVLFYEDSLKNLVIDPYQLIESILSHMNYLYLNDKNQYSINFKIMCETFYKWHKYDLLNNVENDCDDEIQNYLNIIEDNKFEELVEISLVNSQFLARIIDDFCCYEMIKKCDVNGFYEKDCEINNFMMNHLPNSLKKSNEQKLKK